MKKKKKERKIKKGTKHDSQKFGKTNISFPWNTCFLKSRIFRQKTVLLKSTCPPFKHYNLHGILIMQLAEM